MYYQRPMFRNRYGIHLDVTATLRNPNTFVSFCPEFIPTTKDVGIRVKAHFKINNIYVVYPDHINYSNRGRLCWYSKEAKWACMMEDLMVIKSINSNIEYKLKYI